MKGAILNSFQNRSFRCQLPSRKITTISFHMLLHCIVLCENLLGHFHSFVSELRHWKLIHSISTLNARCSVQGGCFVSELPENIRSALFYCFWHVTLAVVSKQASQRLFHLGISRAREASVRHWKSIHNRDPYANGRGTCRL